MKEKRRSPVDKRGSHTEGEIEEGKDKRKREKRGKRKKERMKKKERKRAVFFLPQNGIFSLGRTLIEELGEKRERQQNWHLFSTKY